MTTKIMRTFDTPLPIDVALPQLTAALASNDAAVLVAPPGAGKTTRVPLVLLDEPWAKDRKILVLEPRRLAARAAAARMASTLREQVGDTVGLRVRFDSKVTKRTRIEIVTEGVLRVLDHPAAATSDFSSLRSVISGGSPLSRDLLLRARPVFGDVFFPHFGMAETYSSGLILRREHQITNGSDEIVRRLGSAGTPHVSIEARVVGGDGADVPRDNLSEGEIWLRGDSVAAEYFRMPEETAAAHDGDWFKTGDIAVMDDGGFITVVDRAKDVIITGGINVHGREVEEVLLTHPGIAAAAVVGIPHPTWGEQVHAVVVPIAGARLDERDVLAHCAERLAGYKKPRSVSIVADLPMTATGKVRKRELRERFGEHASEPTD